jgi:hypothetical protein
MSSVGCNVIFAAIGALAFSAPAAMAQNRMHRTAIKYDTRYRAPYYEGEIYCIPDDRAIHAAAVEVTRWLP